ncbi:uncharacterized protein TRIVIDRAFT_49060 [Trichoderma virens Gv29-8]|uniref:Small ribosomal subunit protein bS6m n=2 Tax=Trichoderma TaxID=5543 RepID=G9MYD4_HYPVG|nr:uncharacterized protein TRIVIDRAFT_49060 [Trichoderma virens Gv29-8]EHK20556.1 hypothetical protein TRIVIDRAFT_49060 [Trichoderma virens Gv29-8]
MHRPRTLGNGLKRLVPALRSRRSYVTEADVESARRYCLRQLHDYDAHLIRRFMPPPVQDTYAALRALNLELVRLPEMVSNPTIGVMRMKFWHDSIDKTFAGQPPREPICILLHQGLQQLEQRAGGSTTKSIKFWVSRLIRTRERHMDNRPFATLASLEDYAEHTYSTMLYATLASMPLRSMHVDHLASHIGKACGIVAVLRGVPVLAAPAQPVQTPSGVETPSRNQALLLPLDILAEEGVKEEQVFRQGPNAPGLQDAIFRVATRANDHLITAREMLKRLKAGQDPGHDFEHQGEGEHQYDDESDTARDVRRGFGVLLEAVPAAQWLLNLEKANFDPFAVKSSGAVAKMLYELIAIVRPGNLTEVKEIAQTVGSLVLKNGGVIRGLSNWGVFSLPKPISIHQMKHTHGHYFVMRYDSSPRVHHDVRSTLRLEPRMIRAAHVKLGDGKLETVSRFGPPKWRTQGSEA